MFLILFGTSIHFVTLVVLVLYRIYSKLVEWSHITKLKQSHDDILEILQEEQEIMDLVTYLFRSSKYTKKERYPRRLVVELEHLCGLFHDANYKLEKLEDMIVEIKL